MKLSIRHVTAGDIGNLSTMVADMFSEIQHDYPAVDGQEIEKMMFSILANLKNHNSVFLIAYDGKKPTGFFIGNIGTHAYGQPEKIGIGQDVYVVPEKRGSIVGLSLIQKAVEYALSMGAEGFEAVGTFGGTDKKWIGLGFKPYLTYLYMPKSEAESVFVRHRKQAQEGDNHDK